MESSIDKEQAPTVDEHFKQLLNDDTTLDEKGHIITFKDFPDWFDADLFKKAQKCYKSYMLGYTMASLIGLIDVLAIPSILKVLIFTKNSGIPCAAFRRYAMTILHTHHMYTCDINDPESRFYKSLATIRWKHCRASKSCKKSQCEEIKNRDLALTQFGFMGYVLIKSKEFGFSRDSSEKEAVVHFWRVIGHLIGIPDRLNICRKNARETTELCEKIMEEVMIKYVKENPPHFREMTVTMIEGVSGVDLALDNDAILHFFYKLHNLSYEKELSMYSWLNMKYREIVLASSQIPIIGYLTRSFNNVLLKTILWTLDGYPLIAWSKFGKEKSRFLLYPNIPLY